MSGIPSTSTIRVIYFVPRPSTLPPMAEQLFWSNISILKNARSHGNSKTISNRGEIPKKERKEKIENNSKSEIWQKLHLKILFNSFLFRRTFRMSFLDSLAENNHQHVASALQCTRLNVKLIYGVSEICAARTEA